MANNRRKGGEAAEVQADQHDEEQAAEIEARMKDGDVSVDDVIEKAASLEPEDQKAARKLYARLDERSQYEAKVRMGKEKRIRDSRAYPMPKEETLRWNYAVEMMADQGHFHIDLFLMVQAEVVPLRSLQGATQLRLDEIVRSDMDHPPSYADFQAEFRKNWWDGKACVVKWSVEQDNRRSQVAWGSFRLLEDPVTIMKRELQTKVELERAKAQAEREIRELREGPKPPPVVVQPAPDGTAEIPVPPGGAVHMHMHHPAQPQPQAQQNNGGGGGGEIHRVVQTILSPVVDLFRGQMDQQQRNNEALTNKITDMSNGMVAGLTALSKSITDLAARPPQAPTAPQGPVYDPEQARRDRDRDLEVLKLSQQLDAAKAAVENERRFGQQTAESERRIADERVRIAQLEAQLKTRENEVEALKSRPVQPTETVEQRIKNMLDETLKPIREKLDEDEDDEDDKGEIKAGNVDYGNGVKIPFDPRTGEAPGPLTQLLVNRDAIKEVAGMAAEGLVGVIGFAKEMLKEKEGEREAMQKAIHAQQNARQKQVEATQREAEAARAKAQAERDRAEAEQVRAEAQATRLAYEQEANRLREESAAKDAALRAAFENEQRAKANGHETEKAQPQVFVDPTPQASPPQSPPADEGTVF